MHNDPELKALIKQSETATVGGGEDNAEDTEKEPLKSTAGESNDSNGENQIEQSLTATVNISKTTKSSNNKKPSHQAIPSQSMDSIITETQTRIINESVGTNPVPSAINIAASSLGSNAALAMTPIVCIP